MTLDAPTVPDRRPPWFTPDLELFADNVRRFIEREFLPHEARWTEQRKVDREAWLQAGAAGLLCPSIPEAYGGGGGDFRHDAVISMEMARAAFTFGGSLHSAIVAHYLLRYGSESQKQRWLPALARGERVAAIAMTEPGAGSDLKNVRTRARREGTEYVLDGAKTFITNGIHANLVVVVAKTDISAGARGVSLIVLETEDAEAAGSFRRGRNLEKLGQKTQDTAELFFDGVRVPAANLLGVEGAGFGQLMQQLQRERMHIAVGAQATMRRALEITLEHARVRQVFGGPLMDLQNTRFKLAECATKVEVAQRFVDDCMLRLLRDELDPATAAMAKWWSTQSCWEVLDECLQLHGGYGYMLEYPIARMLANARVWRIYGGSNEIMKEIVARSL